MPGNSQRKGSIRKTAKKPTVGSGGRVKRGLEGRGPTPKAKDRPYHQAHKAAKKKAAKSSAARPKRRNTGDAETAHQALETELQHAQGLNAPVIFSGLVTDDDPDAGVPIDPARVTGVDLVEPDPEA